jgi:membrane protease YdiL (CAAX protease family)
MFFPTKGLIELTRGIFNAIIIFCTGFLFGIPELIPFALAYLYFIKTPKYEKLNLRRIHFRYVFILLIILAPIIILTNLLSAILLEEYNTQNVVTSLKSEVGIPLRYLIALLFIAPIFEEFYFRDILINYLKKKTGPFWAIFLSSLYFSIIHFNIAAGSTLFSLGILLGMVSYISNSIIYCIFLHMLFNSIMIFFIK